jgi:hypothetical protein
MAGETRGIAWPWILVPIFALIVFAGLRSCKEAPAEAQTATLVGS